MRRSALASRVGIDGALLGGVDQRLAGVRERFEQALGLALDVDVCGERIRRDELAPE